MKLGPRAIDGFTRAQEAAFTTAVGGFLTRSGRGRDEAVLRQRVREAARCGLRSERGVGVFVVLSEALGEGFERRLAWARELLDPSVPLLEGERADKLLARAAEEGGPERGELLASCSLLVDTFARDVGPAAVVAPCPRPQEPGFLFWVSV